jgi:hypothetical protein
VWCVWCAMREGGWEGVRCVMREGGCEVCVVCVCMCVFNVDYPPSVKNLPRGSIGLDEGY